MYFLHDGKVKIGEELIEKFIRVFEIIKNQSHFRSAIDVLIYCCWNIRIMEYQNKGCLRSHQHLMYQFGLQKS